MGPPIMNLNKLPGLISLTVILAPHDFMCYNWVWVSEKAFTQRPANVGLGLNGLSVEQSNGRIAVKRVAHLE